MTLRYRAEDLRAFAFDLLCKKGLHSDMAGTVADVLLEGDLLGHTTHGLQLLKPYLKELEAGIVLAASVAHSLHQDYLLDLLVAGSDMFELTEGTKTSRFARLHEILADVQPGPEALSEETICQWADQLCQLHEVVFILQGWHSPLASLLQRIDQFECSRTVVVIGSEEHSCPDDVDMTWPGTIHCLTPDMILKQQVLEL